jgi:phage tail tube protein FII
MNPALILTMMDVRLAERAGSSRPLKVSKITLPPVKFMTVNRNPGGGAMSVDINMPRIEPLAPGFDTYGPDDEIFSVLGLKDRWTFGCSYKKHNTGVVIPARIIIEGVLNEWSMGDLNPSETQTAAHMFSEVTHYEFSLDGVERFYADDEEIEIRQDGISLTAPHKRAAGLPT